MRMFVAAALLLAACTPTRPAEAVRPP
ncbi:MAG: hypothetical protein JWO86_7272, partial [Myxococcaceae bacterium]|nr:hypothetical protein [Myxococcaceae bacterium]